MAGSAGAAWNSAMSSADESGGGALPQLRIHWPEFLNRWIFGRDEAKKREAKASAVPVARFQNICISRETGSGGDAIARLVGNRLSWKVYNDELLEAIAHRMELPVEEVRAFDELAPSVVQDWLLPLREEHYAPQEAYLDHLAKLVESIGRAGESIIVGRGAGFLLPRESTLSIRLIAPLNVRAARVAERMGVSFRTGRRAARDLDRRRDHFDRTMHRMDSKDPHNYDLVLDTNSLGFEIVSEIIVRAVEVGRPHQPERGQWSYSPPLKADMEPQPIPPRKPEPLDPEAR
mgnify:CR=1 FL=1